MWDVLSRLNESHGHEGTVMGLKFLSVKNYEKYQHYKDRNPPWVKVYWDLLSDDKFIMLTMEERSLYLHMILLASRHGNVIPLDGNYIRLQLKLNAEPNLRTLISAGFLIATCKPGPSKRVEEKLHDAMPLDQRERKSSEKELEGEKEKKENTCETPENGARIIVPSQKGISVKTWEAYSCAYLKRYGSIPVRNKKINGQLCSLVERLGAEEAPLVAAFYVEHNNPYYVRERHPVDALLKSAEGLRTQWATGVKATTGEAKNAERRDDVSEQFKRLMGAEVKHG